MQNEPRVEYLLRLTVNGRKLNRVVIDLHFQRRHPDMSIELIMELVKKLELEDSPKVAENSDFEYFRRQPVFFDGKSYRLVFCLHKSQSFLGIINAFRIRNDR